MAKKRGQLGLDEEKFIEDNNLDANKIHTFVQKNYPKIFQKLFDLA